MTLEGSRRRALAAGLSADMVARPRDRVVRTPAEGGVDARTSAFLASRAGFNTSLAMGRDGGGATDPPRTFVRKSATIRVGHKSRCKVSLLDSPLQWRDEYLDRAARSSRSGAAADSRDRTRHQHLRLSCDLEL